MYACIHEIGASFFEGVRRLEDRSLTFRDPPRHAGIRESYRASVAYGDARHSESLFTVPSSCIWQ
jgi:hypothetical protein